MQEEREKHQREEPKIPEEAGMTEEVSDPSLDEEQPAEELEPVTPDEEESQSTDEDEAEEESVVEAEDDDPLEEEPSRQHGCLMGCVTPMAVIFAVALVIFAIVYSKRDAITQSLFKRIVAKTQNDVLNNLPEGLDSNEMETDFEKVKLAMKEGRVNEAALTEALEEYQDAIGEKPSEEQREQAISELMKDLSAAIMRDAR